MEPAPSTVRDIPRSQGSRFSRVMGTSPATPPPSLQLVAFWATVSRALAAETITCATAFVPLASLFDGHVKVGGVCRLFSGSRYRIHAKGTGFRLYSPPMMDATAEIHDRSGATSCGHSPFRPDSSDDGCSLEAHVRTTQAHQGTPTHAGKSRHSARTEAAAPYPYLVSYTQHPLFGQTYE